jgi:hypothetical protein
VALVRQAAAKNTNSDTNNHGVLTFCVAWLFPSAPGQGLFVTNPLNRPRSSNSFWASGRYGTNCKTSMT